MLSRSVGCGSSHVSRNSSRARRSAEGLQSCQAQLNTCEEKLSKTFLAVIIQWATERHDVDLHVIDPAGEDFDYERNTIGGRPGELGTDTIKGLWVKIV